MTQKNQPLIRSKEVFLQARWDRAVKVKYGRHDEIVPPKPSKGDAAYLVVKAALSALPIVGGPAAELFGALVTPPLEKRREAWMEQVATALRRLGAEKGITLEGLQQNEAFTSLLVQATVVAIRNHHNEKREALRNCVLNAAIPSDLDPDIQLSFVRFIDELSPSRIKLLLLMKDLEALISPLRTYDELYRLLAPHLAGTVSEAVFKMMCMGLETRGLIWISQDIGDFPGIYETSAVLAEERGMDLPRVVISQVGRSFLQFIAQPVEGAG